jgi:hypothetical protein
MSREEIVSRRSEGTVATTAASGATTEPSTVDPSSHDVWIDALVSPGPNASTHAGQSAGDHRPVVLAITTAHGASVQSTARTAGAPGHRSSAARMAAPISSAP